LAVIFAGWNARFLIVAWTAPLAASLELAAVLVPDAVALIVLVAAALLVAAAELLELLALWELEPQPASASATGSENSESRLIGRSVPL
jgi:hypothetical protein